METCIIKGPSDCKISINHEPQHNGGGPLFIEQFLSKPNILKKFTAKKNVMEMCSGPGFMGYFLAHQLKLQDAYFVDINPQVEECYSINKERVDFNVHFTLSDGFSSYTGPNVDLIVLNPPHLVKEEDFQYFTKAVPAWFPIDTAEKEKQSRLIVLDEGFKFHTEFCNQVYDKLNTNGQIAFLEHGGYIPHTRLQKHLGDKFHYELVKSTDSNAKHFYLLIATKK